VSTLTFLVDQIRRPAVFYEHAHINQAGAVRITAEAKAETRERIVEIAARLFTTDGWNSTTTRGIAAAAGIAAGTLFNYFESKEAIVAALMSEALEEAQEEVRKRRGGNESLEEELFSLIWAELRSLRRFRKFLPAAAETVLSPLRRSSEDGPGESLRVNHLQAVEEIIAAHGIPKPLPPLTLQLYWTLYLGVFAYWATDDSSQQEDSLALLDQSLKLFVSALDRARKGEKDHERQSQRSHRRTASGSKRRRTKRS
jgi:AcrR family transcriptional regulator